jgi:hypothetical protein
MAPLHRGHQRTTMASVSSIIMVDFGSFTSSSCTCDGMFEILSRTPQWFERERDIEAG